MKKRMFKYIFFVSIMSCVSVYTAEPEYIPEHDSGSETGQPRTSPHTVTPDNVAPERQVVTTDQKALYALVTKQIQMMDSPTVSVAIFKALLSQLDIIDPTKKLSKIFYDRYYNQYIAPGGDVFQKLNTFFSSASSWEISQQYIALNLAQRTDVKNVFNAFKAIAADRNDLSRLSLAVQERISELTRQQQEKIRLDTETKQKIDEQERQEAAAAKAAADEKVEQEAAIAQKAAEEAAKSPLLKAMEKGDKSAITEIITKELPDVSDFSYENMNDVLKEYIVTILQQLGAQDDLQSLEVFFKEQGSNAITLQQLLEVLSQDYEQDDPVALILKEAITKFYTKIEVKLTQLQAAYSSGDQSKINTVLKDLVDSIQESLEREKYPAPNKNVALTYGKLNDRLRVLLIDIVTDLDPNNTNLIDAITQKFTSNRALSGEDIIDWFTAQKEKNEKLVTVLEDAVKVYMSEIYDPEIAEQKTIGAKQAGFVDLKTKIKGMLASQNDLFQKLLGLVFDTSESDIAPEEGVAYREALGRLTGLPIGSLTDRGALEAAFKEKQKSLQNDIDTIAQTVQGTTGRAILVSPEFSEQLSELASKLADLQDVFNTAKEISGDTEKPFESAVADAQQAAQEGLADAQQSGDEETIAWWNQLLKWLQELQAWIQAFIKANNVVAGATYASSNGQ